MLYLAIPVSAYETFFKRLSSLQIRQSERIKQVVYDPTSSCRAVDTLAILTAMGHFESAGVFAAARARMASSSCYTVFELGRITSQVMNVGWDGQSASCTCCVLHLDH